MVIIGLLTILLIYFFKVSMKCTIFIVMMSNISINIIYGVYSVHASPFSHNGTVSFDIITSMWFCWLDFTKSYFVVTLLIITEKSLPNKSWNISLYASSDTLESLAWASAQIHCLCTTSGKLASLVKQKMASPEKTHVAMSSK